MIKNLTVNLAIAAVVITVLYGMIVCGQTVAHEMFAPLSNLNK